MRQTALDVLESNVVTELFALLRSPIGPSLVLWAGAILLSVSGRWVRRPGWLTGLALFFAVVSGIFWLDLRFQPVVPTFSRAWQPLFQTGANLVWVGDGWNWYVAGLVLLLGALGLLLDINGDNPPARRTSVSLAMHLAVMASAMLFVSSANILSVVFTWVLLDLFILLRSVVSINATPTSDAASRPQAHSRGLSLLGALLMLMALLPAGPAGPDQPLQGGALPFETIVLLVAAALVRSGVYPFHFWLLPASDEKPNLSARLIDHMLPVLTGLWLMGWCISLGGQSILASAEVLSFLVLSMFAAAFAAFTAKDQRGQATFVLIAAASLAVLCGSLFYRGDTTAAMLWPATTFVLGGGLWLVGERIWQGWGWQLPISVGALTLAGVPFTPGFLMQPSLSRLLLAGPGYLFLFVGYAMAQGLLIAALLRSWSGVRRNDAAEVTPVRVLRLMAAAIALAIPLALAGFLPIILSAIAGIPGAIPPLLGSPPSVVAELPVWVTLALPLALGIGLMLLAPRLSQRTWDWFTRSGQFLRLDWLFQGAWWGLGRLSGHWGAGFGVIEGAGYMGWMLAVILMAYMLIQ